MGEAGEHEVPVELRPADAQAVEGLGRRPSEARTRSAGRSGERHAREGVPSRSFWAAAYYRQQRDRGCSHQAALRALAFKWIRILCRCWQDRTPYNESTYLNALKRRGSPLLNSSPRALRMLDSPPQGVSWAACRVDDLPSLASLETAPPALQ